MRRPRIFSALAALGTAGHHGYEVRAGVGLVFEPFLGRRGAVAMWAVALPSWAVMALAGRGRQVEKMLAMNNASGFAGALVHFALWPWELRKGIPFLTEAEGLTEAELPAYNAILHLWLLAGAAALVFETPRHARPWALLGLLSGEPLRRSARHHFAWAREQAQREPERWSPALRA